MRVINQGRLAGLTGVALVGGMSRRFGRDKRIEPLDGVPLTERTAATLDQACGRLFLVTSAEAGLPEGLRLPEHVLLQDRQAGKGVMGGIWTGLEVATTEEIFVAACDMPFLSAELIRFLAESRGEAAAVVPQVGGQVHTACAVYTKACLASLRAAVVADRLEVRKWLEEVEVRYVTETEHVSAGFKPEVLTNVNTEADWRRAVGGV